MTKHSIEKIIRTYSISNINTFSFKHHKRLQMNLAQITDNIIETAQKAANFIRSEREKFSISDILTKGKNDFVSYVDKTSEQIIVENLKKILPNSGFLTEEGTESLSEKQLIWIIDPLDGTTNFIHGLEPHAVSIALRDGNTLVAGVVLEIGKNELFSTFKDGGAFLNGRPIHVSNIAQVDNGLFATGFPYYDYTRLPQFMETLAFFMNNSHGLRRLGSAATDLAYVAAGRFEGFYEYGLHAWDTAAGALLVCEAGGKVCDFSGQEDKWLFSGEIIASNQAVFDTFKSEINRMMC